MTLLLALLLAATPSLPDLQQRLAEERAAAQKLAGRESTLLGRLAELERLIELESRALRAAQVRLRAATVRLAESETHAREAETKVAKATEALEPRLFARYKMGREGYLRFLLGSRSIGEVLRRRRIFNALLEADLDALAVLKIEVEGARAARNELAAANAELGQSVQMESDRRASLQQRIDQQKQVLAAVQEEKGVHEQAARELEEAERNLTTRLREIERARLTPGKPLLIAPEIRLEASIRRARGRLSFPVVGGRVEVHFGRTTDPRFGTVTLQHGIDVRAPLGAPVRAVWGGKVVHAGWFKGYGNLLIVDHGRGIFSLMAHLDQLERAVGDGVRAGEEVGTVGDTGSLKGPYLYFELRDRQRPLDPERWLHRARRGPPLLAGTKGGAVR
ncbi:MAG: peptidase M23 [Deltaproteobacteria bacterium]|nr:MAG: peptidase M23 [Deltaproteobacteria bacterium]